MRIEAVIVCINYSDFLSHTLPHNKNQFDKIVVVTDPNDEETQRVCDFFNVQCIQTVGMYYGGDTVPNKGRAINAGLQALEKTGWVVQLDADIYLPPLTRHILESYPLNPHCLYGIDRLMCNSYADWYKYMHKTGKPVHEGWIYLHTEIFQIGTRLVQYYGDGYLPIGFFQLWHPGTSGISRYPTADVGYDRSDVVFLKQWARVHRQLIPDLLCIHLANAAHSMGQNWTGRKTPRFEPDPGQPVYHPLNFWQRLWQRLKLWFCGLYDRHFYYGKKVKQTK
jgi:hypothetical protein